MWASRLTDRRLEQRARSIADRRLEQRARSIIDRRLEQRARSIADRRCLDHQLTGRFNLDFGDFQIPSNHFF